MENRKIKCVVWDLDCTIWDGILLENNEVQMYEGIVCILENLDKRGILQSISSKNNYNLAMNKLRKFGIDKYFIYPQINWNPKSESIKTIAKHINISLDTIAFIDDQIFEREEVNFVLPEILCVDATNINKLLDMPEMNPRFVLKDSRRRRELYQRDIERNTMEEKFQGTKEEFLASLNMFFTVSPVEEGDLMRAEELAVRTHQLNATGYTYSYEELYNFSKDDEHDLIIAELKDKYGSYGKIGLVLIEKNKDSWTLKLLLMSCRVMSRGVGSVLLNYVLMLAKAAGVKLYAEFLPTDRNRMMYITYKLLGFKEVSKENNLITLEHDLKEIPKIPYYIELKEKIQSRQAR
ncbi:hypothetical protein CF050_06870 [Clostridium botulinum]|uniref:HAD-IIIC family phosphatase n=1 Tax=Clostridium botulinum TaxID=1491 RepID=UPI000518E162|nr:HAD-IIIC family phosphatase [Clostridium botulinum]MBN3346607.1 hypothetical protein [Clostridium botulinum]